MIDVERRAGGAWVTLNRPAVLNALDPAMVEALDAALDELQEDAAVRAVAITGAGRAFCAGADLEFAAGDEAQVGVDRFILELGRLFTRIERFPKPTIAAVNGSAAGGGFELILCCDLVVAASTARIGDSHANFGLVPGGGASARLPRKVASNVAKQLLFTGDLLPAGELARAGLVNHVAEDLVGDVDALMQKLAARSPLGLRRMKELANASLDQSLDAALEAEIVASNEHRRSYDNAEGVASFREKRSPIFLGR